MKRRDFLKATAVLGPSRWLQAAPGPESIGLEDCIIVTPEAMTARESKAVTVLVEEAEKRCGIRWAVETARARAAAVTVYAATRASWRSLGPRVASVAGEGAGPGREGYTIRTGNDAQGRWIALLGADQRGLLFGAGKLLRSVAFGTQRAFTNPRRLNYSTSPKYALRGHQLGYRPKTNSYDAWTVAMWDQYMRDMAVFGTNAIELIPPRSDDEPYSPHYPLPPERMMVEMSRLADSRGHGPGIGERDFAKSPSLSRAVCINCSHRVILAKVISIRTDFFWSWH